MYVSLADILWLSRCIITEMNQNDSYITFFTVTVTVMPLRQYTSNHAATVHRLELPANYHFGKRFGQSSLGGEQSGQLEFIKSVHRLLVIMSS